MVPRSDRLRLQNTLAKVKRFLLFRETSGLKLKQILIAMRVYVILVVHVRVWT